MNMLSKFKLLLYEKFKFICYYIILKGKIIPVIYQIQHWTDEKHALKKVCTMNTKCYDSGKQQIRHLTCSCTWPFNCSLLPISQVQ